MQARSRRSVCGGQAIILGGPVGLLPPGLGGSGVVSEKKIRNWKSGNAISWHLSNLTQLLTWDEKSDLNHFL